MKHLTRTSIVVTILMLGVYVTGLQEEAVSPVFDWFGDLPAGVQLLILVCIAGAVGVVLTWRRRRRLSQLREAHAEVERNTVLT